MPSQGKTIVFKPDTNGKKYFNRIEGTLEGLYGDLERHETTKILINYIREIVETLPEDRQKALEGVDNVE